jgi:hypothetical protein
MAKTGLDDKRGFHLDFWVEIFVDPRADQDGTRRAFRSGLGRAESGLAALG